jgi:hypothetical protein
MKVATDHYVYDSVGRQTGVSECLTLRLDRVRRGTLYRSTRRNLQPRGYNRAFTRFIILPSLLLFFSVVPIRKLQC